jgi:hypothetical protein
MRADAAGQFQRRQTRGACAEPASNLVKSPTVESSAVDRLECPLVCPVTWSVTWRNARSRLLAVAVAPPTYYCNSAVLEK